jgi:Tlde1 domain
VPPLPQPRPLTRTAAVREEAHRVVATAVADTRSIFEKLFGKPLSSLTTMAYADAGSTGSLGTVQNPAVGLYDRTTAVYDISAHKVYMPDGSTLEAHSGLGELLDDPRHADVKMRGVTPPAVYDLQPREALFHGVEALRLIPEDEDKALGRTGLLAHSFMLGPNGDSNGCVSFRDYSAFLRAYKNHEITRLAVVTRLD